jgi:hypothetical protein
MIKCIPNRVTRWSGELDAHGRFNLGEGRLYPLDRRLGGPQNRPRCCGEGKNVFNGASTCVCECVYWGDCFLFKVLSTHLSGEEGKHMKRNLVWSLSLPWTRSLRHETFSPARTLGSCVRIPLKAWMSVYMRLFCVCVVLCVGSGLETG